MFHHSIVRFSSKKISNIGIIKKCMFRLAVILDFDPSEHFFLVLFLM